MYAAAAVAIAISLLPVVVTARLFGMRSWYFAAGVAFSVFAVAVCLFIVMS